MTGLGEDGGDADSRCCLQGEEVAACHDGLTVRASAEDACTLAEVKEEEEEEEEEEGRRLQIGLLAPRESQVLG